MRITSHSYPQKVNYAYLALLFILTPNVELTLVSLLTKTKFSFSHNNSFSHSLFMVLLSCLLSMVLLCKGNINAPQKYY